MVKIQVREISDGGFMAEIVNINPYIKKITGKAPARYEHYMRYDYGTSRQEAVDNLVGRLRSEDGYSGKYDVLE